jgi:putative membrane protein
LKTNSIKQEWLSIIRNKKLLIPVIAILFIPVLYSGMFLWAFWDPYDRLDDLPVAVVNEDKGAVLDGKKIELGDDLVAKLKESDDFQFHIVNDKQTAYKDLRNQKYYLLMEIPADFSKNATTLLDENPKKLQLVYVPNESYNFLAAQIGGTAIEKIKTSVAEKVSETYAESMFDKVEELADGMTAASEGAKKIDEGAVALKDGSKTIYESLAELANKSLEFNGGMTKANGGSKDVAVGAQQLSTGLAQLQDGHSQLAAAANQMLSGEKELAAGISDAKAGLEAAKAKLPDMVNGTEQLLAGTQALLEQVQAGATTTSSSAVQINLGILGLQQQLAPVISQLPADQQAAIHATFAQLADGSKQIADGNAQLANMIASPNGGGKITAGFTALLDGQKQLQSGINQLADGSARLDAGAARVVSGQQQFTAGMQIFAEKLAEAGGGSAKLAKGAAELSGGLTQLADGTTKIVDGAGKLADGAGELSSGTVELADGTAELAGKLADGASQASSVNGNDKTYNMIASPVKVENEKINEVPNYGTGFAPYFLSLGLFVGALLLSIVFPLKEPAAVPKNGLSWFVSKFAVAGAIGVIQALIAVAILLFGLDIQVESVPLFILFAVMTSICFVTLIQVLVTTMADAGRFVAILILILQLTTSAGTFPLELIPDFLQHFNAFLPMTYSVHGFKAVISSGDFAFMWHNLGVLAVFVLVFVGATIAYLSAVHKHGYSGVSKDVGKLAEE